MKRHLVFFEFYHSYQILVPTTSTGSSQTTIRKLLYMLHMLYIIFGICAFTRWLDKFGKTPQLLFWNVSSRVFSGCQLLCRRIHTGCKWKASRRCVPCTCVLSDLFSLWRISHIACSWMAFRHCASSCVSSACRLGWRNNCTGRTEMVFLQCACTRVSSDLSPQYKNIHTGDNCMVSNRCVPASVVSCCNQQCLCTRNGNIYNQTASYLVFPLSLWILWHCPLFFQLSNLKAFLKIPLSSWWTLSYFWNYPV